MHGPGPKDGNAEPNKRMLPWGPFYTPIRGPFWKPIDKIEAGWPSEAKHETPRRRIQRLRQALHCFCHGVFISVEVFTTI